MKYIQLIFILLLAVGIKAQNAPISLIPSTETTNDTMMVEVLTENFTGILSLNLHLDYDSTVAHAFYIVAGTALGGNYNINISQPGSIAIGWYTSNAVTLPDSSILFSIMFSKNASGNIGLTWFDDGYSCTYSDASFQTLNDLPTENFYISSSNTFLPSAPPAPAGPISGNSTVCPTTRTSYSVEPINGATGYNWLIPPYSAIVDGYNSPQITLEFDYNFTGGTLSVAGTNINGQGAFSSPFPINIPVSPVIILQPENDTVTATTPDTAVFSVILNKPAEDYAWQEFRETWHTLNDNNMYSGTHTPELHIHNATISMNGYHYRCLYTDECSNASETDGEATLTVTVISSVNFSSAEALNAKASPNPFNDHLKISLTTGVATRIEYSLVNVNGTILLNDQASLVSGKNEIVLFIPGLEKGVYLLKMETEIGVEVIKILK